MLKIIAAMAAACAVLAGLALAIDQESASGQPSPTDTPTPAATDTATPASTATAAPASTGSASPTATQRTLTPAAVPGTGGEPGSSTSLLLILALGAGVVAGAAGLAGIAVMRRS